MLQKRTRRPRRRYVLSACAVVAGTGLVVGGWGPYVHPRVDTPHRADAIVVLGGAHDGREEYGIELASEGLAPQIVFSNPYGNDPYMNRLCNETFSFEVSCFDPKPSTTRGEGQEIARRAAAEGWNSVIVVTFTPHISRARHIIEQCWDGEVMMTESPTDIPVLAWAWSFVWQTAGFVRSEIEGC